jgi:hypothetical protein
MEMRKKWFGQPHFGKKKKFDFYNNEFISEKRVQ